MHYRRPAPILALVVLITLSFSVSFYIAQPFQYTPERLKSLSSYFSALSANAQNCPNPLVPIPAASALQPVCQPLSANPELGLAVQACFAPDVANQGHFLIERVSADECAVAEKRNPSPHPETNRMLRSHGPDVFHVAIDGEERRATEVAVEYLGSCRYKYPFHLISAAPINVTIWWSFSNYRAVDETETMSLQWDLAEPVLRDRWLMLTPPATAGQGCGKVSAIPTQAQWRSASEVEYMDTVPECSRHDGIPGRFLRAHWSEPHTFQGYMFQPTGCRWSEPIHVDASPNVTQEGWMPHSVLFWGDSHVRYAFDVMSYIYNGNWDKYKRTPAMKALKKTEYIGPVNMTFIWDSVIREFKFEMSCKNLAEFDIIVLGASHHNLVMTDEADHDRQWTIAHFGDLVRGLAAKFAPNACPGQKMPRIIWMGSPARPLKLSLPPKNHPLNKSWKDARVNTRLYHFGEEAWNALKHLPGAARVNLFDISESLADSFVDGLHMIMTDVQAAFVQDLHHKLWLRQPAYSHLSPERP